MIRLENILIATDFSGSADAALSYGRMLAERFGATLHVVYVVENIVLKSITADGFVGILPEVQGEVEAVARRQLEDKLKAAFAGEPHPRGILLTSNTAADAILSYAVHGKIDLIVMGTHGRSGVTRWLLGSVAERVVRASPCPVLTVHEPPRESARPEAQQAAALA